MENTVSAISTTQSRVANLNNRNTGAVNILRPDFVEADKPKMTTTQKSLIGIGALTALAVGTIGILRGKTGVILKAKSLQGRASKLLNNVQDIPAKAQKELDEVSSLISKGQETEFKTYTTEAGRKIVFEDGKSPLEKVMNEYIDGSDLLQRRTVFYASNGDVTKIAKKIKVEADVATTAEVFKYEDGKLRTYMSNKAERRNGGFQAENILKFDDGKLESFGKKLKKVGAGNSEFDEIFMYQDNKFVRYNKNRNCHSGILTIGEDFALANNKVTDYLEATMYIDSQLVSMQRGYKENRGKLLKIPNYLK